MHCFHQNIQSTVKFIPCIKYTFNTETDIDLVVQETPSIILVVIVPATRIDIINLFEAIVVYYAFTPYVLSRQYDNIFIIVMTIYNIMPKTYIRYL